MEPLYDILVIGGSGLVGRKLIELLIENKFPFKTIKSTLSRSLVNNKLIVKNYEVELVSLDKEEVFDNVDFCFFCSTAEISKKYVYKAKEKCKYVIDNSSCFRMNNDVPLIVPEINFKDINSNLISNPNCSTIQSVLVLDQIRKEYEINKIIYSTYQSCSGGGKEELNELINSYYNKNKLYSHNLCDTCISQIGEINETRFSLEELKMINETKKVLNDYSLNIHASCVRVPVNYCHGVFIYIEVTQEVNIDRIIELIKEAPRLKYVNDNEILYFQEAYEKDHVLVGRLKKDITNPHAFSLFCVGDNLRVGAAFNAYNIAIKLIGENNGKI